MYRPYKFLVVAVIQEVDEEGRVTQELSAQEPTVLFGTEGLHRFANEFDVSQLTPAENLQQPPANGGVPPGIAGMLGGLVGGAPGQ